MGKGVIHDLINVCQNLPCVLVFANVWTSLNTLKMAAVNCQTPDTSVMAVQHVVVNIRQHVSMVYVAVNIRSENYQLMNSGYLHNRHCNVEIMITLFVSILL